MTLVEAAALIVTLAVAMILSRTFSTGIVDPVRRMVSKVHLDIQVPPTFPEKYHEALVKSASLCAVKKHMENPPEFAINTVVTAEQA